MPNSASTISTPASPDVATLSILIDGSEIPGSFQIKAVSVTKEANRIPTARLVLLDGEAAKQTFEISNQAFFLPGKKIEIQAGYRANNDTIFKGIVVCHSVKIRQNGSSLTVDCKDEAVKMTLDRKSKYFLEQKDSDVVEDLIGAYGLTKDVEVTNLKHKELVQFDTTDWDFMLTRSEANGQLCIADDGKVSVKKPKMSGQPVLSVAFGTTIMEFDAEMDARHQFQAVKSMSWSHTDQAIVEAGANEPGFAGSGNVSTDDIAKSVEVAEFTERHGGMLAQPELQNWADARLARQRLAKICGRVRFQGFAGVKPGLLLELQGVGERFDGKVFISGVHHEIGKGNWLTDVQFGLNPAWLSQIVDLRPPAAAGLLPPVNGLQIGIVTKIEGDPDGEDRIQVRLPVVSPDDEGIWARVATLDAGDNRGSFFRPELNDEVLVGFLNDDPRHPVVLGMCHSSAKPAPHQPTDDNHEKGFVTRSKMRLWFDDDKKIVTLETPAGNKLQMTEEDKAIMIEDQNGNKIVMNSDGISIESSKDIILKASKDIKAEGVNIELKASGNFKAEGNSGATVKASATATLEGGAMAVVKGGMVQIN
ncbi:MAG: type VI secretion system tip protein VgrG [Saprospiraceae bacterium]|nr:type VI secretion system tip protein VgrG [Saprospiraceae bacterium]